MLDMALPLHADIDRRLRTEPLIWLTTSEPRGCPHIVSMWFLWDGKTIVLFSLPNTRKLRNIALNPGLALALQAVGEGYDVSIIQGNASLLDDPNVTALMPGFVDKYANVPRRWPPTEWA